MKLTTVTGLVLVAVASLASFVQAQTSQSEKIGTELIGTWSGDWTPKGGVLDAITVEFKQESSGKLTAKFLHPASTDFNAVSLNSTTGMVEFEGVDTKTEKRYKLVGKVHGTEIKGTLDAGDVPGEVLLIKWTYRP